MSVPFSAAAVFFSKMLSSLLDKLSKYMQVDRVQHVSVGGRSLRRVQNSKLLNVD